MTESAAFQPISPPKQPAPFALSEGIYKVYKTVDDCMQVKAHSALEAIKNSGVENVYRVERDSLDKNYLIDLAKGSEMLLKKEEAPAAAPPADAAAAAPAAPAEETPKA